VPVILGVGTLFFSLLTRYEAGLFKIIPFKVHLMFDVLAGAFLAVSPWLFGFASVVYLPHLMVGLFEIVAGLTTRDSSAPVGHRSHVRHA
jgi:hypothetical protein